jgi:hypothetical protein
MRKKDPRVDAYIAKSADFAQPILRHLREIVYEGCPEVEETMEAARLNETGEKVPRKPPQPKKLLATPPDLAAALKKNAKARATFQGFQPQPQEGIRRVDHRCQDGGDPQEAAPYRSRVDGRGQASELEIHALKRAASVALTGLEE